MSITKNYGNICLNYCVLHLFRHKILFLPFPSLFSLIITIFAISELPQNSTKKKPGTKRYVQRLNIKELNFLKMFG